LQILFNAVDNAEPHNQQQNKRDHKGECDFHRRTDIDRHGSDQL
jgi:hypothetical protein